MKTTIGQIRKLLIESLDDSIFSLEADFKNEQIEVLPVLYDALLEKTGSELETWKRLFQLALEACDVSIISTYMTGSDIMFDVAYDDEYLKSDRVGPTGSKTRRNVHKAIGWFLGGQDYDAEKARSIEDYIVWEKIWVEVDYKLDWIVVRVNIKA